MKKTLTAFLAMAANISTIIFQSATSANPDPVVLTFSSEAGKIQMELGFIKELKLEPKGDKYLVRVTFETEGTKFYNRFAFQYRDLQTEFYICEDKVFTYTTMPYLRNDSFNLPIEYSKADADAVMNLLFYGDNCENYL